MKMKQSLLIGGATIALLLPLSFSQVNRANASTTALPSALRGTWHGSNNSSVTFNKYSISTWHIVGVDGDAFKKINWHYAGSNHYNISARNYNNAPKGGIKTSIQVVKKGGQIEYRQKQQGDAWSQWIALH